MKRFLITTTLLAVLFATAYVSYTHLRSDNNEQAYLKVNTESALYKEVQNLKEERKNGEGANRRNEQGIKYAEEFLHQLRANPVTGKVDPADILEVRKEILTRRNNPSLRQSSLGLDWEVIGPDDIGGRTRALLIDKDDPNKLYAGGVTGGLFVSTNAGSSWQLHPDYPKWGHLGISSIEQAPNGDIYVGTGESFVITLDNGVGHLGGGIFKSSDGGQTFDLLTSTEPAWNDDRDAWGWVNEISVDPNNSNIVFAALGYGNFTRGGLYRSDDAGASWKKLTTGVIGNDTLRNVTDVLVTGNGIVHAAFRDKYYRSDDGGENFTLMSGVNGFPIFNVISRIEFAVSPEDANYVYAGMSNPSDGTYGVFKSTDGGDSWSPYSPINSETFNPLGEQGDYNLAFTVNAADKDEALFGGQLYKVTGGNTIGWDVTASAGGVAPISPHYIHADMHAIIFNMANKNNYYVVSDGGVFKTLNGQDQFPTYTERNKGYITTQHYNIGVGYNGAVTGGMQDNGSVLINGQGNTALSSEALTGGDGGYTEISKLNPDAIFTESQFGSIRRSSNGGASFGCMWSAEVDGDGDCVPDGSPTSFIPVFQLWEEWPIDTIITDSVTNTMDTIYESNPRGIIAMGALNRIYVTEQALDFSTTPIWNRINFTSANMITSLEFTKDGLLYAGTSSGRVFRIEGLPTANFIQPSTNNAQPQVQGVTSTQVWSSNSANIGTRYVSGLGVDPNDNDHILVTLGQYGTSSHVYRSFDAPSGQQSFTDITSDLPPMPVYDAVIDYYNEDNYIIGTDVGIWASSDAGQSWTEENLNVPSSPVFTVEQHSLYENSCQVLYAGSYGSGIFRSVSLVNAATGGNCDLEPFKNPVGIAEVPSSDIRTAGIYPNPIVNEAYIDIDLKEATDLNVRIIGLIGSVQRNIELGSYQPGAHKFQLDFSDIPRGMYLVTIEANNGFQTKKIFVTK